MSKAFRLEKHIGDFSTFEHFQTFYFKVYNLKAFKF